MSTAKPGMSPFDQGQHAGKGTEGYPIENPFAEGTVQHNNFEIGRRFGAEHSRTSAQALIPDEDEDEQT